MADNNKASFAVSVTPKVTLSETNTKYQAMTVIHENIRKSLGGSGEVSNASPASGGTGGVTVSAGTAGTWVDGVNTPISSDGGVFATTTSTDLVCVKHLGTLVADDSACTAADDRVKIGINGATTVGAGDNTLLIAELYSGEAMVIPRPAFAIGYLLTKVGAAVNVEVTVIGT